MTIIYSRADGPKGNASGVFIAGYLIQALIVVRDPNYPAPVWQGFLCVIAVTLICVLVNIWGERQLPGMQNATMCLYITAFLATVVVLWDLGPRIDAKTALLDFTDEGGWSTIGLALMVSQSDRLYQSRRAIGSAVSRDVR